jgi:cysteine-rich repeat protein
MNGTHVDNHSRALGVLLLLAASCGGDSSTGDDGPPPCVNGEFCVGELSCVDGFCVDLGSTSESDGSGDGDEGDGDGDEGDGDEGDGDEGDGDGDEGDGDGDEGDGDGDEGDGDGDDLCPDGTLGCECLMNSSCDSDLACVDGLCVSEFCGNGLVDPGEACDDGNDIVDDACTNVCALPACGDAIVHSDEDCDDGNANDQDDCLMNCEAASCGDGQVHLGVEDCDDQNVDNADACLSTCEAASCGDGFLHVGFESCDDGNQDDIDVCTSGCDWNENLTKYVFVTSSTYNGNLGGVAGADQKCQSLAGAAGLPGTYMAWISDGNLSPSTRFTQSAYPYVLVNGQKIADNWADLIDVSLDSPINADEYGDPAPASSSAPCGEQLTYVWSGTRPEGIPSNDSFCSGWTATNGYGHWGRTNKTNTHWSAHCSGGDCTGTAPIFCFRQ